MATVVDAVSGSITDFNYIVFGLIFLVYLGLNSQIFYDRVLTKFNGTLNVGIPTNYGTIIQALIMALMAVLIYSLYEYEII